MSKPRNSSTRCFKQKVIDKNQGRHTSLFNITRKRTFRSFQVTIRMVIELFPIQIQVSRIVWRRTVGIVFGPSPHHRKVDHESPICQSTLTTTERNNHKHEIIIKKKIYTHNYTIFLYIAYCSDSVARHAQPRQTRGRNESTAGGTAEPENQRVDVDGPCNAAYVAVQGVLTCQAYPPRKTEESPETLRNPWISWILG